MRQWFSKIVFKRMWFVLLALFGAYLLFVNGIFLYLQYLGAYVVLYDPFHQSFEEISWIVFFLNSVVALVIIGNYIKKLIRSYKNKGFSEKK